MNLTAEKSDSRTKEESSGEFQFAHYADSTSVTEGYILGKPVMAICGKLFVPSRDPKNFPICPICKELADALMLGTE